MVVLEGPPLPDQPWQEIDSSGPILVVVLPQVQAEIDKRKRDGRLAERARAFNRLIGPAVDQQRPVRISETSVRVDLVLAECGKVDYDALDLDRDEGDQRVVAQMLNARRIDLCRSVLISHDINPIAVALRNNLKAKRLPDHWLLSPEPGPKDRENARLKAENKELRKTQPELNLEIEVQLPSQFTPLCVLPLTEADRDGVLAVIEEKFGLNKPKAPQAYAVLSPISSEPSERDISKYRKERIPRYMSNLPATLQALHNQVSFSVTIENVGPITASRLVVEISVNGGKFDTVFHAGEIGPPSPPKGRNPFDLNNFRHAAFPDRIHIPGDHDLHWGVESERGTYGELHCREYRQGRRDTIQAFVELLPSASGALAIKVRATALSFCI